MSKQIEDRSPEEVATVIDERLSTFRLAELIATYFTPSRGFAADTFDTVGDNDPYAVTCDDLLAVSFLDVSIPPMTARTMLGIDRGRVARLLHAVDPDVDLWEETRSAGPLEAAFELWDWVQSEDYLGVGPVIAGKLLARKRPRLIPIVDSVVIDSLRAEPMTYWKSIAHALKTETRRTNIDALRPTCLSPAVTTLRVLDVAIWMLGSRSTAARSVRQEFDVAEPTYRR